MNLIVETTSISRGKRQLYSGGVATEIVGTPALARRRDAYLKKPVGKTTPLDPSMITLEFPDSSFNAAGNDRLPRLDIASWRLNFNRISGKSTSDGVVRTLIEQQGANVLLVRDS